MAGFVGRVALAILHAHSPRLVKQISLLLSFIKTYKIEADLPLHPREDYQSIDCSENGESTRVYWSFETEPEEEFDEYTHPRVYLYVRA